MNTIKEWIRQIVIAYIKEQFTYDNFSDCLKKIVAMLADKAKETENSIDDYVVEYLEFIVANEDKIKVFYDYVYKYCLSAKPLLSMKPIDSDVKAILFETGQCEQVVSEATYENLVGFTSIIFNDMKDWFIEDMSK